MTFRRRSLVRMKYSYACVVPRSIALISCNGEVDTLRLRVLRRTSRDWSLPEKSQSWARMPTVGVKAIVSWASSPAGDTPNS